VIQKNHYFCGGEERIKSSKEWDQARFRIGENESYIKAKKLELFYWDRK
jgi:hypothetical protein